MQGHSDALKCSNISLGKAYIPGLRADRLVHVAEDGAGPDVIVLLICFVAEVVVCIPRPADMESPIPDTMMMMIEMMNNQHLYVT